MKGSEAFKETIKAYLDKKAEADEHFKIKYNNKKLDDIVTYILNQVKESGQNGFTSDEIYDMAVHCVDENLKPGSPISSGQVVVNHHVELSKEEIEELKEKARKEVIEAEKERMTKKKVSSKPKQVSSSNNELSLF